METNRKLGIYFATGSFYITIILLLGVFTFPVNRYLAIAEFVIALILFVINYIYKTYSQKRLSAMFEKLSLDVGSATGNALIHFPLATLIMHTDGRIKWYNEHFSEIFSAEQMYDKNINEIIPELSAETFQKDPAVPFLLTITHGGRTFRVFGSNPKAQEKKNDIAVLYFDDITEYISYKEEYNRAKTFASLIFVDNYEELMDSAESGTKPHLQAKLNRIINDWANENGGVIVQYEKDKYYVLFEQCHLEKLIQNKFDILGKVRSISEGNTIPASVSIGLGVNGNNVTENDAFAKTAINMALGRGGDQVVLKDGEKFSFYGGNSKEYEKSTRVKARVVSNALSGLISNAESVVVMSHKDADIDALGAAFGVYRMCRMQDKNVHILLETYDQTVKNMLERLENVEEYAGLFINSQQAASKINAKTLIVVVDTHKPALLENAALLSKADQRVVIDHHRRGTEFIENPALIYHEPYASSTCEMLTEILQYSSNKMSLTKLEAECLYAGIVIDTKNFTFKTGVRTFEAASFLRKQGVDTVSIKTMLQQDFSTYIKRASIIKDAEIIRDHIAISSFTERDDNMHVLIAQAADEMLNIKGITASFVLCATEEGVNISGRSLGGINVQVILEKLGGGGHMTIAGAQLPSLTIEEAKENLIHAIDEYYTETAN